MTFSTKFTYFDNREAALLDDLSGETRVAFEQLCAAYDADFRPENDIERDSVYCLATLRRGIDRIRECEDITRAAFRAHGYLSPKMKLALDELAHYREELDLRYEYFFSAYSHLKRAA